jgi:hypothetical protein
MRVGVAQLTHSVRRKIVRGRSTCLDACTFVATSMRMRLRTLSALLVGATVAAVLISTQGQGEQLAHEARINRTPSAEVLKFHAVMQARFDIQFAQPEMAQASQAPDIWRMPAIKRTRVG